MHFRRCAVAASRLIVFATALVACGDGGADLEVGDIVAARDDDQFSDGSPSSVALPMGKLEIALGVPTTRLAATDTRQLEAIAAPAGSTFLPLTWQYDAATFGDYADYLDTESSPAIDLVVDGASYRLPAPRETGEGSISFYVLVSGSGDAPVLEVEFDGVTQTLNLVTGERDAGQAAALYDLKPPRENPRSCAKDVKFATEFVVADFACSVRRVTRLPYAGSAWAEPGHTWLAVTLRTTLRQYTLPATDYLSGAIYYPTEVTPTFTLGKLKPTAVLENRAARFCPDTQQGGCTTVYNVVFDLTKGASTRITANLLYDLTLFSVYGGADAADTLEAPVRVRTEVR